MATQPTLPHRMLRLYLPVYLMLSLLQGCGGGAETTQPTVEDISESVYASGLVKSLNQYQVYPVVSGVIEEVLVTEGDTVRRGQALVRLNNETARLSTENARLAAEYARVGANAEKLGELREAIGLARSRMHNDSLLLVRQRNLWAKQIGTKVELEQRELAYKNSVTAYRSAQLRYTDMRKQLDFAARQSQKNLQISETMRDDYQVKSEIDGKVYSMLREKGELVSPQVPVAIVGDARAFLLELQVDEYDISRIQPGQQVLLHFDSYRGQVYEGRISKINPAMNERTRSFTVEAEFVTQPERLYPNLSTEANIIIQKKKDALTIPREYLVDGGYVLKSKDERIPVKTGLKDYQKVEIVEGLSAEDQIIKP